MKIPIRVRLALWILKRFCDNFYQCEKCPFYKEPNENVRSSCIFSQVINVKFIDIIRRYRGLEYELTIEVRKDNYFRYSITITDDTQVPQELKDIELRQINDWFIKGDKSIVINLR